MFLDLGTNWVKAVISNFAIENVDLVLGSTGMFRIRIYAEVAISDGTVKYLNTNTFSLSSSDYKYVGSNGGIFTFYQTSVNSSHSTVTYTIRNAVFDVLYGDKGTTFYFGTNSGVKNTHTTLITLNNILIRNSFYIHIACLIRIRISRCNNQNSEFNSNTGVNGEADLRVIKTKSLEIDSTLFTLFNSFRSEAVGQSITFTMSLPLSLIQ